MIASGFPPISASSPDATNGAVAEKTTLLFTEVAAAPVRERNFVRWAFLGESAKELLDDWPSN
jgi:hypothetical protein